MKLFLLFMSLLIFWSCDSSRQSDNANALAQQTTTNQSSTNRKASANCVNLNKASADELKTLPEIGEVMAQKIIEYRKQHGGFRRPQELIILEGFSEKKYRALADLVCVE